MQQREILVGRDDVDAVGHDNHAVGGFGDRHGGEALQQIGQGADMFRGKVLDDDEGHAAA